MATPCGSGCNVLCLHTKYGFALVLQFMLYRDLQTMYRDLQTMYRALQTMYRALQTMYRALQFFLRLTMNPTPPGNP
jgi:hypothetical protein